MCQYMGRRLCGIHTIGPETPVVVVKRFHFPRVGVLAEVQTARAITLVCESNFWQERLLLGSQLPICYAISLYNTGTSCSTDTIPSYAKIIITTAINVAVNDYISTLVFIGFIKCKSDRVVTLRKFARINSCHCCTIRCHCSKISYCTARCFTNFYGNCTTFTRLLRNIRICIESNCYQRINLSVYY